MTPETDKELPEEKANNGQSQSAGCSSGWKAPVDGAFSAASQSLSRR